MKPEKICLLIAAGLFVTAMLIVVSSGIYKEQKYQHERREREESFKKKLAEEEVAFQNMPPKEHLAKMKEVDFGYQMERHRDAIPKDTLEYREARRFIENKKHQKRIQFATTVTNHMLDNEINFMASTAGKDDTILICEFAILTDVTIHHIRKKWDPTGVREIGFKKVLLTSRLRRGYEYELWSSPDIDK